MDQNANNDGEAPGSPLPQHMLPHPTVAPGAPTKNNKVPKQEGQLRPRRLFFEDEGPSTPERVSSK
jgi:hypothetical protein